MMSSIVPKISSLCSSGHLNCDVLCQALSTFRGIVESCYGPFGRLKLIHNAVGGYVLTTSQSSVLLRNLSVFHPVINLLIASVLNHVSRFNDSGLFTAILCCNLAESAKRLTIPSSRIVKIHKHLLNICIDYLTSEECSCRIQIDFSNSKTLLSLVRTVINKPTCMLTTKEADYISSLVLKAFFNTIPSVIGDNVSLGKMLIVPIEGQSVNDSCVLSGILIEIFASHSTPIDITKLTSGCIKIAVFSVSMSGDVVDSGNGNWEVASDFCPEDESIVQLLNVGKQLVCDQVHLVVCQKVIHPILKQYLQEQQVMVEDRLGLNLMEPLIQLTGAQSIGSYYHPISPGCYGNVKNLCVVKFGLKRFLHLVPNENKPVCSLLICNRSEAGVNELKVDLAFRWGPVFFLYHVRWRRLFSLGVHVSSVDLEACEKEMGADRQERLWRASQERSSQSRSILLFFPKLLVQIQKTEVAQQIVCQSAECVMRLALKEPLAVLGGGCTESHLATYVGHKMLNVYRKKHVMIDLPDPFQHSPTPNGPLFKHQPNTLIWKEALLKQRVYFRAFPDVLCKLSEGTDDEAGLRNSLLRKHHCL
ncbi:McKusick-Kaufman/Bardet-Biedl syndromes putative chaperonin isoform X2 [Heterodontus francisci]|uniref:McKusick-Kaufman/Bardet-Biedl syndromes putative chaperonin isoform X2 n=1 Tax=Heterodontus francisci TaxID=7792 RepID=UPI00355BFBBA